MAVSIRREEFDHLAALAHLKFDEEEIPAFMAEFDELKGFVDMIGEENTDEGKAGEYLPLFSLREDEVRPPRERAQILSNTVTNGEFFEVRQVVR